MAYELSIINSRAISDPIDFIGQCDAIYQRKIEKAASQIIENMKHSPIALLSGPSGSGKTTTAHKIREELQKRGIATHSIAMDDYFRSRDSYTIPLTPEGAPDLESPLCVDMELLNDHFTLLGEGRAVIIPKFDFSRQMRIIKPSRSLRLGKDEVAIFEGIHALNDDITSVHPEAFKLYISARSDVVNGDETCFKGTWMRLVRRTVRDNLFRGADAASTLGMWANVRRGERKYISPFKDKADLMFDSSFPYEVCIMKNLAMDLFSAVPRGVQRYIELQNVMPAFTLFKEISPDLLAPDSLLREFVGGGIYDC